MSTISAKVSKKELDAIQEYANACGETMSNLIRKVLIRESTFMNGSADVEEYHCFISIPDNLLVKKKQNSFKEHTTKLEEF